MAGGYSHSHDANGNRSIGSQYSIYSYDEENQLTQFYNDPVPFGSGAKKTEFVYDGKGRLRVRKEYFWNASQSAWGTEGETRYIYSGMLHVQERSSANTPTVSYTRGWDLSSSLEGAGGIGGLLARTHGYSSGAGTWSTHSFYHADGNGNITAMVNSSQASVASYKYDPYGNLFSSSGTLASANLYRFSSKLWCANAALYYYGYRFYDPSLQRWLNQDPIGELGGINLYGFVRNNPLSSIDPYGWSDQNRPPVVAFPSGPAVYGPPRNEPAGRPPSGSKVGCAMRVGRAAKEKYLAADGTRYTHCMASCEIAKQCGKGVSPAAGFGKELADLARCLATHSPDYCYSAFQPSDGADNKQGRDCPSDESCEDRCKDLKGGPETPPGPFNNVPDYSAGMF